MRGQGYSEYEISGFIQKECGCSPTVRCWRSKEKEGQGKAGQTRLERTVTEKPAYVIT